jgi:hypothetical protein
LQIVRRHRLGTNCLNDDSTPGHSYDTYARQFIYNINIPGCTGEGRLFVGQRKDPFVVNLGETFDLVNYTHPVGETFANTQPNSIGGKNVTSLILEVPISCVVTNTTPIIGGWTTASLPQTRVATSRTTGQTSKSAICARSRDWACRWLMNW